MARGQHGLSDQTAWTRRWPALGGAGIAVVASLLLTSSSGAGQGAPSPLGLRGGTFRTRITRVLHTGDAAPGIDGAVVEWVGKAQIDAAGAVWLEGFISGPGINRSNDLVRWYGLPGELVVAVREGDQVPGLPPGVIYDDWELSSILGEDGTASVGAILSGPGVIPDVNDKALLVGKAGALELMARAGDQAPGFPEGVILTTEGNYVALLADDGRFLTRFHLAGPGIDESNETAFWAVDDTGWHKIVQTGDAAPGTEPGVTFAWIDGVLFNNSLSIVFRGGVTGNPVDPTNDVGYWSGPPGDLQLVAREGDPAPDLGPDVFLLLAGSFPSLQGEGDVGFGGTVVGEDITQDNNDALFVGRPGELRVLAREDDQVPGLNEPLRYELPSNLIINERREAMFSGRLRGDVEEWEDRIVMYGPYDAPRVALREGDPIRGQDPGIVFDDRLYGIGATNDFGNAIQVAGLTGPGVGPDNEIIFLLRDHRTAIWYPLLREGCEIEGRTFLMDVIQDSVGMFWTRTGGSDGLRQSLSNSHQLAINLDFSDNSLGVYVLQLPLLGDFDEDGDIDLFDYEEFQRCVTGPGPTILPPGCDPGDIDWDSDVDLSDFGLFQILFGLQE